MPRLRSILTVLCIWIAFPALAESAKASGVERLAAADLRVATIGFRLLTANSSRCGSQMPATGLLLHSLAQYRGSFRDHALEAWSFPAAVSIESVVPDSPAARAGLHSGDGLVAIGDQVLALSPPPDAPTTALRDRAEELLGTMPASTLIPLKISRGDRVLEIAILPVPACRSRIEVAPGLRFAAQSDGRTIQLGLAFVERVDDEGLSVAIAHELAHTILDHRARLARLEAAGRSTKPLARQFEDQADLLSLDLLSGAGWDPAIAPRFMRREGRRYDPALPGSGKHRSAHDRARRMEDEIARRVTATACARANTSVFRSQPCLIPSTAG